VILSAGLTPAWQQIMRFTRLDRGEVNRAAEVHWCASGKAINVGMALSALGIASHTLSPAGGWSGQSMRDEFVARRIPATWTPSIAPTRICTTLLNDADGSSTELVENAACLTDAELDEFRRQFDALSASATAAVLTGSLPKGTPPTFYQGLLKGTRCPVVLDARGPELLAALECRPPVVKPNRAELALTVGRPLDDRPAVFAAMRELIERGAQSVVVTHGKAAIWVMDGASAWELAPPGVMPVVNPIGCGDCLAAGIALGLARGESLVDAVRLGIALASDNVTQLLPARLSSDRVDGWLRKTPPPAPVATGA
jgi:1-phosphofructokinase family hexose kinase